MVVGRKNKGKTVENEREKLKKDWLQADDGCFVCLQLAAFTVLIVSIGLQTSGSFETPPW